MGLENIFWAYLAWNYLSFPKLSEIWRSDILWQGSLPKREHYVLTIILFLITCYKIRVGQPYFVWYKKAQILVMCQGQSLVPEPGFFKGLVINFLSPVRGQSGLVWAQSGSSPGSSFKGSTHHQKTLNAQNALLSLLP